MISLVGYTPDIFVSPAAGWLLDRAPGAAGHQHLLLSLAAFSALGITAAFLIRRAVRHR